MDNNDKVKTKFFEDNYLIFEREIEKRRYKWQLKGVMMLDFDDVKFIILAHIYKKLHLYKEEYPLPNWTNTIISNQTHNLMRNLYYNHVKPCQKCACALPDDGCELFSEQSNVCPVYKRWEMTKKSANEIKMALPSENHINEIFNMPAEEFNYEQAEARLHIEMEKVLKPLEWNVYKLMFIEHLTDAQIAKKMKWTTKEKSRKPGYGNIIRLKKIFLEKARKIKEDVDLF